MKHIWKRILATMLAAAMLLSVSVTAAAYSDVSADSWYADYVDLASEAGLMNGYPDGSFNPDGSLTREMFVTILHRAAGEPSAKGTVPFVDVTDAWYAVAVLWAYEKGYVLGYDADTFGVGDALTREQMVTILYRIFGSKANEKVLKSFKDADRISGYAEEAFAWAVANEIIQGDNGMLRPQNITTRAQAAKVMALVEALEEEPSETVRPVEPTPDPEPDPEPDPGPEPEPTALTRADLEAAVVELGFAYHLKGDQLQYDSVVVTDGLDHYHGATYRLSRGAAPEFGTSDTTIYSVCSDYVYKVYAEALDYLMFGSQDYLDATTTAMWLFSEQHGAAKMRWMSDSFKRSLAGSNASDPNAEAYWGITEEDGCTMEEMRAFLENWEENLRPGDVILPTGHAMLYVGNGYVLDCYGIKYNMDTGLEYAEGVGGVPYLRTVEDLYLEGDDKYVGSAWCLNEKSTFNWFLVFRPLDMLVEADTDQDLSNDVVKDAAYALPADTATRLENPGMTIDRTVDATPFGTVAQNGTLTYTVAISNKSNAETYTRLQTAASGSAYTGEAYEGLVVTETIPAGTELVEGSISHGGTCTDGVITWTVDLAAGETVELTYAVTASAERGTVIVNDGGFVGEIASNSISNTVGGADLSETALSGLENFAKTNSTDWRAQYNVSNTATGLTFAERIYAKAMGIGLDLPELQDVVDNLFRKETITNPSGSIRFTHTMTANLLVLQEPVPEAYQAVRDMMAASYVGGRALYFEDAAETINEFHTDYLTAGDILVYADLDAQDQVTENQVLVCLGDGTFASLTSGHKMSKVSGDSAKLLLWKAFTYDLFFVLRPSEAYDDISAMAYDATEPEYGDEVVIIDPTTQKRQLPLNDANKAKLAAAEATGWSNSNVAFALDVYREVMGIDLSEHLGGLSQTGILAALFYDAGHNPSTGSTHFYTLLDRDSDEVENKHLYDMMVAPLCGGPDMDTSTIEGAVAQLQISDLEAGDILTWGTRSGARDYWNAVYLGDGKLLLAIYDASTKVRAWELRDYSGENAAKFAEIFQEREWQYWFVLRPYLGYDDINAETIVEIVETTPLSEENQTKLKALAGTLEFGVTAVNSKYAGQVYAMINLDIDGDGGLNAQSNSNLRAKLFHTSANIHTKMASATAGYEALYRMLVPGYFGGSKMNTELDAAGEPVSVMNPANAKIDDLEIGDVLILGNQTAKDYWTGIYVGDGKMIMSQYKSVTGNLGTIELWDFSGENAAKYPALLQDSDKAWEYFFLLRPYEGYANINTRLITPVEPEPEPDPEPEQPGDYVELSAENQAKLTALAISYQTGGQAVNAKFAGQIYKEIGLDIDTNGLAAASSSKLLQTMFNSENNTVTMQATPKNAVVKKMLVPGYFGGKQMSDKDTDGNPVERKTEFAVSDLEIGDVLVLGRYSKTVDKVTISADYWTGIYLGYGRMLISQYKSETGNVGTIQLHDFSGENAAKYPALLADETLNWDYFFLLRPYMGFADINACTIESTEPEQPGDYVELSAGNQAKLTALAISYQTGGQAKNAQIVDDIYKGIGLDVYDKDGLGGLSGSNLLATVFKRDTNVNTITLMTTPTNATVKKMLVPGYFGGKQMTDVDTDGNPVERKMEFSVSDLEIGDVLVMGRYKVAPISADYWTGIYLGYGRMLISEYKSESGNYGTIQLHDFSGDNAAKYPALLADETLNWDYFFLLRPYMGFANINNQTVSAS